MQPPQSTSPRAVPRENMGLKHHAESSSSGTVETRLMTSRSQNGRISSSIQSQHGKPVGTRVQPMKAAMWAMSSKSMEVRLPRALEPTPYTSPEGRLWSQGTLFGALIFNICLAGFQICVRLVAHFFCLIFPFWNEYVYPIPPVPSLYLGSKLLVLLIYFYLTGSYL